MNDQTAFLVAFYYVGLLIFSLLGLVWLGHKRSVEEHARVVARINRLMIKSVKVKRRR